MADATVRESSSNTLVITCCSRAASTPARAPASIRARMSSDVTRSSRTVGRPSRAARRLASQLNSHTSGLNSAVSHCMGRLTNTASRSGSAIERRLGSRSASRMNSEVMRTKEARKPTVAAVSGASQGVSQPEKYGVSAPSPTTPPRMATAFTPICTTVKYSPGCSCVRITSPARASPSSTIWRSRSLRDAAKEISAIEKNELAAISRTMVRRLSSRLMHNSVARACCRRRTGLAQRRVRSSAPAGA